MDGYRHLAEVAAWNRLVHDAVHGELASGRLPILLGGDHSLAIGSIAAVGRHCRDTGKRLRVLWLDAHADFNTSVLTPSGNLHGMPVACLCGHGPRELVEIGGTVPAMSPGAIRQVGIRSVDQGEKHFVHEIGLEVFDMRYIDEMGMRQAMELALATLDAQTNLNLAEKGELNPKEIAQQTSMDKAKVSRAIKELSAKRCVVKHRHEGDRRAYRLSLSERGLALYRQIVPLALAWEGRLLDALDASEYRDLNRIIEKLARRLDEGPS